MPFDLDKLFNEYDDLAADVARSNHTFFAGNLKRWFDFLDQTSPFARPVLQHLEPAGHFPTWFEPYRIMMVTGGGIGTFKWPEDRLQRLSMQFHLLRRMTGAEIDPGIFALTVLHIFSMKAGIATIIEQIFVPTSRELRRYLQEQTAIEDARARAAIVPEEILAQMGVSVEPLGPKQTRRAADQGTGRKPQRAAARRNRDDFPEATKRALALRAGYLCSLPECKKLTAGPSAESSTAVAVLGVAAHICAASSGGARYDAAMSAEERSHIDNGIWLCTDHATLIDRDRTTYTIEKLRAIKRAHESERSKSLLNPAAALVLHVDSQRSPVPDWPIRDLFFHIRPDVLDDVISRAWEEVGRDVIDKFSTNQLKVWGRRIEDSKRLALAEIPAQDWPRAKFTYWFLKEQDGVSLDVDCYQAPRGSAPIQYADLQVCRAQALMLWPKSPAD